MACAGCDQPIKEKYLDKILDRTWHTYCVKCYDCRSELTGKCFFREGKLFCKRDFFLRFGAQCTGCSQGILPEDYVNWARDKVYHVRCFTCIKCNKGLSTGDELYILDDNRLLCKRDYLATQHNNQDFHHHHHHHHHLRSHPQQQPPLHLQGELLLHPQQQAPPPSLDLLHQPPLSFTSDMIATTPGSTEDSTSTPTGDLTPTGNLLTVTAPTTPSSTPSIVSPGEDNSMNGLESSLRRNSTSIKQEGGLGSSLPGGGSGQPTNHHHSHHTNTSSSNNSNRNNHDNNHNNNSNSNHNNNNHHHNNSNHSNKNSDHKPTRVRTVLNEKQLSILRSCYCANPRPDALIKERLVESTGLSARVIRVWFQNKRCKDKKKTILMKQIQQQEKDGRQLQSIANMHGVPLVATSPVQHEIPHPIEVQSYHPPWKSFVDYTQIQTDFDPDSDSHSHSGQHYDL